MSYPRNAASPPIVAVGAIYLLADGTIQTTGASVRVKTGTGSWGSGAGTLACDSTSGIWTYAPTQGETDAESFIVGVYKSASTSAQVTVATSASATAGYSGIDWGKVIQATTTVNLSGTTISTTQQVASVSGAVGSVTGAVGSVTGAVGSVTARVTANTDQWGGVAVTGMPLPTTSYTAPPTVAQVVTGVYAALPADHTVSGSYGVRLILALNSNRTVQVTASNHIAADVHAFQTDVINAAALAASAVTEIQSGLATSAAVAAVQADVTTLLGRITATLFSGITYLSRWLGALAGKTADASTQTEIRATTAGATYTITTDTRGHPGQLRRRRWLRRRIADDAAGGAGYGREYRGQPQRHHCQREQPSLCSRRDYAVGRRRLPSAQRHADRRDNHGRRRCNPHAAQRDRHRESGMGCGPHCAAGGGDRRDHRGTHAGWVRGITDAAYLDRDHRRRQRSQSSRRLHVADRQQ